MKPRARLRTFPCSASCSPAKGLPCTRTSPAVGASSPPSRCNKVLLPDPETPTTATRSPAMTERSMPSSTGTSSGPLLYVFLKPRHSSTGAALFIAQRLRRIDPRRPPARVDRRQQGQHERDRRHRDHVAALHLRRQLADVIDALVEKLHAQQVLDERHDRVDVEGQQQAADDAEQRADRADQRALNDEDGENARRRRALG